MQGDTMHDDAQRQDDAKKRKEQTISNRGFFWVVTSSGPGCPLKWIENLIYNDEYNSKC
jgi:hypothetical protein